MRPILVALVLLVVAPASAQQRGPVTFTVEAAPPVDPSDPVPALLQTLATNTRLSVVEATQRTPATGSARQRPRIEIRAEFVFQSLGAFAAWRESPENAAMLAALESESPPGRFTTTLRMERDPSGARSLRRSE